jgi:hypothetical protein
VQLQYSIYVLRPIPNSILLSIDRFLSNHKIYGVNSILVQTESIRVSKIWTCTKHEIHCYLCFSKYWIDGRMKQHKYVMLCTTVRAFYTTDKAKKLVKWTSLPCLHQRYSTLHCSLANPALLSNVGPLFYHNIRGNGKEKVTMKLQAYVWFTIHFCAEAMFPLHRAKIILISRQNGTEPTVSNAGNITLLQAGPH